MHMREASNAVVRMKILKAGPRNKSYRSPNRWTDQQTDQPTGTIYENNDIDGDLWNNNDVEVVFIVFIVLIFRECPLSRPVIVGSKKVTNNSKSKVGIIYPARFHIYGGGTRHISWINGTKCMQISPLRLCLTLSSVRVWKRISTKHGSRSHLSRESSSSRYSCHISSPTQDWVLFALSPASLCAYQKLGR